jgi:hypothetical protein
MAMDGNLRGMRYYEVRDNLAGDLLRGIAPQRLEGLVEHVRDRANMTRGQAAEVLEKFVGDLRRDFARR